MGWAAWVASWLTERSINSIMLSAGKLLWGLGSVTGLASCASERLANKLRKTVAARRIVKKGLEIKDEQGEVTISMGVTDL